MTPSQFKLTEYVDLNSDEIPQHWKIYETTKEMINKSKLANHMKNRKQRITQLIAMLYNGVNF